jgi:chitinase
MNCLELFSNKKQLFTCYWGGYFKNDPKYPQTLDMTPECVDIVILAFVGPQQDSTIETTFLCSVYSEEKIKNWIDCCHEKGIKVYVSILDTPQTHWDKINLLTFAKSLKSLIDNWNLDGVDIDAESGMDPDNYIETFINLAKIVKAEIGTLPLTYTCYTGIDGPDGEILKNIKSILDYIQLMAYFDSFDGMVSLYNNYKQIMGDNIIIGVKAGEPDCTNLDEVEQLCIWNSNKKGIMLWTINRDTPQYTNKELYSWTNTIYDSLKLNVIIKIIKLVGNLIK